IRKEKIAKRHLQIKSAEAREQRTATLEKTRTAQVLLSTQHGNRAILDEGFDLGREALAAYAIDRDPDWQSRAQFRLLSEEQQTELRRDLGELLLLLARCELLRALPGDPQAIRAAMEWNRTAEGVFPEEQRPQWLAQQRAELLAAMPGIAQPISRESHSDLDSYHEGLEDALRGRYGEALVKLAPFTQKHNDHFMAWFVRGMCHDGLGQLAE